MSLGLARQLLMTALITFIYQAEPAQLAAQVVVVFVALVSPCSQTLTPNP